MSRAPRPAAPPLGARAARCRAWAVHLYTACGAVLAMLALEAVWRDAYATAFAFLAVAMFIDCTDGTLARRMRVKEVLPEFDGAKLDDIVDYLTYVFVPLALIARADLLPGGAIGLAATALPLVASGYGFCHAHAKTADHFFTGFPSYWNVVALYLYVLGWPPAVNAAVLIFLSVMVLVPIRYLYPSRNPVARPLTYGAGTVWGVAVFALLFQFPSPSHTLALVSLLFPAYYVLLSFWVHFRTPPSPAVSRDRGGVQDDVTDRAG